MPGSLSAPPPELTLRAGQTARFALRGAGAAGFDWRWTIAGDAAAVVIAVEPSTPAPTAALPPAPHIGSIGLVLLVRGVRPGAAQLHLVLARPPKSPLPPLETLTMAITVREASKKLLF